MQTIINHYHIEIVAGIWCVVSTNGARMFTGHGDPGYRQAREFCRRWNMASWNYARQY
jgi:hypothetical protein